MENRWEIKIYKWNTWAEVQVKFENETVWLTQEQISIIFWVDRTVITKHINNIFKTWELEKEVVSAFYEIFIKHFVETISMKV